MQDDGEFMLCSLPISFINKLMVFFMYFLKYCNENPKYNIIHDVFEERGDVVEGGGT